MTDQDKVVADLEAFVAKFESEIDAKLKAMGASHVVWVNEPETEFGDVSVKGSCASQEGCNRCKPKVDPCTVRVCLKRHNCGSNCQVGNDCNVKYCHGREL